jgi:carbonic anhydrase
MINYNEESSSWGGTCSSGKAQSPIDFPAGFQTYNKQVDKIKITKMEYGVKKDGFIEGSLMIQNSLRYTLTGTNLGSITIRKDGTDYQYDATEISFHVSSEHTVMGFNGAVEMQINHKKNTEFLKTSNITDKDKMTNLIISVIFKIGTFYDNPNVSKLNLSTPGSQAVKNFNLGIYPPIGKPFFFYEGSTTIPPCDENVNWVVPHQMHMISPTQFNDFKNWISSTFTSENVKTQSNSRSVKPSGSRIVYYQFYSDQRPLDLGSIFLKSTFIVYIILFFI